MRCRDFQNRMVMLMLKFVTAHCKNDIQCDREDGSSMAYLYYSAGHNKHLIVDVNSHVTSNELRQIADKLDELNDKR